MVVLDASATVTLLLGSRGSVPLEERIAGETVFPEPYFLDLEVVNALRNLVRRGDIRAAAANNALAEFGQLRLIYYPHGPLLPRVWELRHNLTAYDAVYVALAEALDVPLLTFDHRLAQAPSHHAVIEVF